MTAVAGDLPVFADTTGQNIEDSGTGLTGLLAQISALQSDVTALQSALSPNPIDVFLIAGQSNATGTGNGIGGTSPTVPHGMVLQYKYTAGTISDANEPIGDGNSQSHTGSAWPSFGLTYYNAIGHKVLFVPSAFGGTNQSSQADQWAGESGQPNVNWDAPGSNVGSTLWQISVNNLNAAMAAAVVAGYQPIFKGVLWCQGENDAGAIIASSGVYTVAVYQAALAAMIARYRAASIGPAGNQTTYPEMPFYIFQTGCDQSGDATAYQSIRGAQATIAAADSYTSIVFSGAIDFVYTSPQLIQTSPNSLHYTVNGYNKMGHDGAQGVLLGGESNSRVAKTRETLRLSSYSGTGVGGGSGTGAGNIYYLGDGITGANPDGDANVWVLSPVTGRAKNLRFYAKGNNMGTGQSITATVFVAGVATSISCAVNDADRGLSSDTLDEAVVVAGQSISLKVLFTAGISNAISFSASLELDNP